MKLINGSKLPDNLKQTVLETFIHRFTRDHKPEWANGLRESGKPWQVRFDSDQDWLENTEFCIADDGFLSRKYPHCHPNSTWPDGREINPRTSATITTTTTPSMTAYGAATLWYRGYKIQAWGLNITVYDMSGDRPTVIWGETRCHDGRNGWSRCVDWLDSNKPDGTIGETWQIEYDYWRAEKYPEVTAV